MKLFKSAAVIIFLVVILEAFYLLVMPFIIGIGLKNNHLENFVNEYTGLVLHRGEFSVKTKPDFSISVSADNLSVQDSLKNEVFSAEKLNLRVSILSLIFNRPNLKYFYLKNSDLTCSIDKEGNLYFGNFKFKPELIKDLNLYKLNANVENFNIKLYSATLNKNISIHIPSAKTNNYVKDRFLDLELTADVLTDGRHSELNLNLSSPLPIKKHVEELSLNGSIKNLDLNPFSDFVKFYLDKNLDSLEGIVDADFKTNFSDKKNKISLNAQLDGFQVNKKDKFDSIGSLEKINLLFDGQAHLDGLLLDKLEVSSVDWKMFVTGKISDIDKKTAKLDLSVKIPKSQLYPMYHLIPSLPDCDNAIQKLKKYGVWAKIESDLQIKGSVENPHIYGPTTLSELYILEYDPKIPKCKIVMDFKGLEFDMYTKVFTRPNQFVEIKGRADNRLGGKGDFLVKSSPVVNLAVAHKLLLPVHDVVGFDLGPLPYMKISGEGNIDIHTWGTVVDGYVDGIFNFKNTKAVLGGLDAVLDDASGYLSFDDKNMHFETKTARVDGSPLKVSGDADLNGNLNFEVLSDSINSSKLLSIVKKSPDLKMQAKLLEPVERLNGQASLQVNISGFVKDFNKLIEKVRISGIVTLKNNSAKSVYSPVVANNVNAKVTFDGSDWGVNATANLFESKFYLTAKSQKQVLWAAIRSDALKIDSLLNSQIFNTEGKRDLKKFPKTNSFLALKAEYSGKIDKIDYKKIKFTGKFKPLSQSDDSPLTIKSGDVELLGGNLVVKNFYAQIFSSTAKFDATVKDVFSKNSLANYNLKINNFDLSCFDRLKSMRFVPLYLRKILNTYENYSGHADVSIICKNNVQKGSVRLHEIRFLQKALAMPISIYSGDILLDGDNISVKSLNAALDQNPVFMNAVLKNIKGSALYNGYFTAKLTESFVNKYVNNNLTYPIKPKGDITVTSEFSGDSDVLNIKPKIKFSEGSDIYYMGANLGDVSDVRELKGDISLTENLINLKKLSYIRYMTSQNEHTYPLEIITLNGKIIKNKNSYKLSPVRISTLNNANVRIFNIFFKKSVLKQGMFNCNMTLWGDVAAPVIRGQAFMTNLDMPLYDTVIRDVSATFLKNNIDLKFSGQIFDSDFTVDTLIKNRVTLPVVVENVKINSKVLNLDTIINSMTKVTLSNITPSAGKIVEKNTSNVNVTDFIVRQGEMKADSVILRGLPAANYRAKFALGDDAMLRISNLSFDIAGGNVSGLAGYNLKNAKLYAELSAKDVDSNKVASAFFDVKDQIFGLLDGSAVISTSGASEQERLRNVSGSVYFVIKNGKMPKLGSIEYLLKASNLIKSGITGLSLNNFIDLIAPVKTGYFNSIKGLISLKDGKAQNLEIYSSGDTLSLFIKGQFDFPEQNADLTVFGRLTKKADNILGVVGNASFNSLLNLIPGFRLDKSSKAKIIEDLNKIPGVEFNDQSYRMFSAKINGDINGEKYVKSFKWIE